MLLELTDPTLHQQIGRRRHGDFLKQSQHHLWRDGVRDVGQQLDCRAAASKAVGRKGGTKPRGDNNRDRYIAGANKLLRGRASQHRSLPRGGCRALRAEALLVMKALDQSRADVAVILVDDSDTDARGRRVALTAKHGGEDREKDNREQKCQHLRDAIAAQVRPAHPHQCPHYSRSSLPVR